jgi:23S rRNA (adenine2030-N6)-methyltransferase
MFSYRHAFHAGNHADVLKHTVLIATLQYLTEKDAALTVLDTHAGAGLYRLDGDYARTSGEAGEGILRLGTRCSCNEGLVPLLQAMWTWCAPSTRAPNPGLPGLALHHPAPAARARQAQAV